MSEEDCAARALTHRGSSKSWNNQTSIGGLLNRCCYFTRFCQFHRVYLKSCDGLGFAGQQSVGSISYSSRKTGSRLVHSGETIVRETVIFLVKHFGLGNALDVLLAGCSAGGRAALLHAPAIRDLLRAKAVPLRKFKVIGLGSIFFPSVPDSTSKGLALSPAAAHMRAVALNSASIASSSACRERYPMGDRWKCVWGLGPVELMPQDIPVFLVQSVFDLWQTSCVLAAGSSTNSLENGCSGGPLGRCIKWGHVVKAHHALDASCDDEQIEQINSYQLSNVQQLLESSALKRPGYGGFFHACHDHCTTSDALVRLNIGNLTAREAMHRWFHGDDKISYTKNTRWGCIPERSRRSKQSSTMISINAKDSNATITHAVPYGQCVSLCGTSESLGRLTSSRRGIL